MSARVSPAGGSIWYGDIPGALLSSGFALLSFVTFRSSPRAIMAIVLSFLAFKGASVRQSYERNRIEAYCEKLEISDCGEQLGGFPKLGWPVILSPFLGLIFSRKSSATALAKTTRIIAAFTQKRLMTFPILKIAGIVLIFGALTWHGNDVSRYDDLPGALMCFPAVFLSFLALRSSPRWFLAAILSLSALVGVSGRYTFEREELIAGCHLRSCLGIDLPALPEYGWPIVSAPFLALAFTKITRRSQSTANPIPLL